MEDLLEKYDYWYELNKKWINESVAKGNRLLAGFLSLFPIKRIPDLKIDEYVVGKKENSFCWWVESKLSSLGDIRGGQLSAFQRFGIYYDREKKDYVFCNSRTKNPRFGNSTKEVYANVINEICGLLKAVQQSNLESIAINKLNPLFKNKLVYLYDSEHWLPIYSDKDLNIILSLLEIPYSDSEDRIFKRKKLFEFYKSLNRQDLMPQHFMMFIYSDLGLRPYLRNSDITKLNDEVKPKEYKLEEVNSIKELIHSKSSKRNGLASESFETFAQKKITGKKGEEIVKEYLLKHKEKLGIIGEIDCPCEYDDNKHYDFSYHHKDGKTIYIESKATKTNHAGKISFELSDAEYAFMQKNKESYFTFYINDVFNGDVIKKIPANLVVAKPSKYKVTIGIDK
mgnify:CR=1 FL=1